ncbi:MAG TPA: PEP/pyruvate-binding domain-containing protein, partial [Acidimicrobiales bacterium]|nr:PEP/pyruvate-binding domain-containing protein [Acidimicrobiales bacterium]
MTAHLMTEHPMTDRYVMDLEEIGASAAGLVGGKGAHLGELGRIDGILVPGAFCVTTDAFRRAAQEVPGIEARLERLSALDPGDASAVRASSADIRRSLEAVTRSLGELGEHATYAVRSSATAEDLPSASFAGLHDSCLRVERGAVLGQVRRCWASLFSERAVTYRLRNGFDHRRVRMAVVVQPMVRPRAAGTLFTAHPVTSNRKVVTIEAVTGPGDALVAGRVSPDTFEVRGGHVVSGAGTTGSQRSRHAAPSREAVLSHGEALRLACLGRRIEAHFARPQDIEWCLVDDDFWIVQSRPITTLFPIPPAPDGANHVYVSVGHQQMMTDPMEPLGLSIWQLTVLRPMTEAGGRLFVDVTQGLASPTTRGGLLAALGTSEPLIGDALQT